MATAAPVATPGESLVRAPTAAPPSDLRGRVARLLALRTLVVTFVLGLSVWLLAAQEHPARAAMWMQSAIIAGQYVATVVFGALLRSGFRPQRVAKPMLAADLLLTSALVATTGGATSPYIFLYALTIVAAGAVSYRRGAVVVTLAALGAMLAVALLTDQQAVVELIRTLGINTAALIGVGALSYIFGDQLERGAETLATTRRAAAELLTLHQDIVRSLSSGLITTAPDGSVITANESALEILGREDLSGAAIETVMPGVSALVERRADLVVGTKALGVTVSPLRDERDQVVGRVINFQDLTELRRLEQHARRAERLATVGQLAAGVAHEIRNPLASISGSIELLRQSPQASEDDRTLMTIVHREIQRLNLLIGDLLDYANPRPKQAIELDLATLVDEMLQVARADAAFAHVEIKTDLERPLRVTADPAKLRQVLWNLVRNAAEAGAKTVRVEGRPGTTITIIDDGWGMAKDVLARMFDPFFTTKPKGTGLGLAICYAIVAEHGG
ncbi:MAG TPA: ATP-binding protein, partial [Kofleriaceae bacterium]|nr:ATP-binding protein [Kofleriaceae bacterium]